MNNLLQSPKLSSAMNSLSVKRPSLSPLKRKLSDDDETPSPTSTDGALPEESVISPMKKAKLAEKTTNNSTPTSATWSCALSLDDDEPMDDGSDEACAKVLASYTPIAFADEPSAPLDEEELKMLEFFLA
jgi:hypothetical protein